MSTTKGNKAMAKNLFRKIAKDKPYAVYEDPRTGWRWEVLHTWKGKAGEDKDRYARWFCRVKSPIVPYGEMGDVYRSDVLDNAMLVDATDQWRAEYDL
jgi:hypothetical protein|tara:strand:+ start:153 stop:446 length:294 start_codon:yes stop_codon:yes gene_type:complete